jgi:hypothetical protein
LTLVFGKEKDTLDNVDIGFPFFTEKDSDILYGESTRDPLGLLPIWSAVGHDLIPGLASIVSRIDGIQGILFLFTCLQELPRNYERNVSDDELLCFLERLWEYHLNKFSKPPCFGIESLGAIDFRLSIARGGVVSTGLRQYYRGTCINKKILASDLRTLNEPYRSLAKASLDSKVIKWLKSKLPEMASPGYEIAASEAYDTLQKPLEQFSRGNEELWLALERHLISDSGQRPWLEHLVTQYQDFDKLPIPQLVLSIQEYAHKTEDKELVERCQRIMDCEPFIQLLQSVFLIAQEESRNSVSTLARQLENTAPKELSLVCENFQRINFSSHRLAKLKELAESIRDKDYEGFLHGFLHDYYGSVCLERGKNPIVQVDGSTIIALKPEKKGLSWQNSTKTENWENGYFLHTQLSLYQDLMARRSIRHG